ncbi:MAG: T9SS type A sorting domain-containing protein, partial [Candidatus Zixiibacteriota bacterium]
AILSTSMNAIIFMDKRNDEGDIYLQLISSGGTLSGGNILLNTDNSSVPQSEPSLAVSDTAILTVWNDTRSVIGMTGQRIFGKYLDYNGVSISGEFVISDSSNINIKSQPQVTLLPNNTALVVWQEITGGMPMVLGRFLNPDGTFLSSIFTISNDANDIGNDDINLSVSPGNIFVIGWIARDAAGGPMAVVARYNASGAFINRFTYTSPIGGVDISDIAIAIDNSEHIYLLWEGSDSRLYFSRCSSTGLIDINGSMIEDVSSADFEPAITVDSDGNMILCYIRTSANIRRLYYQVFNTSLNAFLKSYASPLVVPFMGSPSIAVANHDLYFVWVDPREDGMNIYSASITYTPSAMDDDKNIVIPDNFSLEQNFPNPFNPSTTIRFNLPHLSKVNLSIYNLLGEKVMTLIDREMTAGVHSISWNGEDENGIKIGSGIYFYRLNSGQYEQSRKMILLK